MHDVSVLQIALDDSDRECTKRFWEIVQRYVAAEETVAVPLRSAA